MKIMDQSIMKVCSQLQAYSFIAAVGADNIEQKFFESKTNTFLRYVK